MTMRAQSRTLLLLNTGVGSNLGDRAMLINVVRQIRDRHPDWMLFVSAQTPAAIVEEFQLAPTSFLIDCLGRWRFKGRNRIAAVLSRTYIAVFGTVHLTVLAAWASICDRVGIKPTGRIMEAEFVRSVLESDAVYFVGGGYMTDQGKLECRALLITGLIASLLGKPLIMSGQGLGPFKTRVSRWLMRGVANRATMIGLRDSGHGLHVLAEIGATTGHAETVCDDAHTLPAWHQVTPESRTIGIHWRVSPHQAETARVQAAIEALLDKLVAEGWNVLLFQFHEREKYEASIYRQWLSSGRWPSARLIKDRDPRVLRAEIARCTVALGMAYHFSVFALAAAVPVLGLWHKPYYRDKIGGLMTAFGHPEWALDDRGISPDSLYETLTKMAASDCGPALVKRGSELAALHEDWQTRVDTRLSQI
ncbi:polysaccharide pyruvyl transferase family protein [Niveibacterium sp.]|uniref:polysaccharide pyruvyl transferase family protein n=1 Tax=Niveibacterium sp. TaxID=2017444 RepID=UPI0035AEC046